MYDHFENLFVLLLKFKDLWVEFGYVQPSQDFSLEMHFLHVRMECRETRALAG